MNRSMKGKRKIEITFEAFDRLVEWGFLVPDEFFSRILKLGIFDRWSKLNSKGGIFGKVCCLPLFNLVCRLPAAGNWPAKEHNSDFSER